MLAKLAGRLVGNVGLYVAGGLAAALAVSLFANWLLFDARDTALKAAATAQSETATCVEANAGNQDTIDDLDRRLKECVGKAQEVDALAAAIDLQLASQADDIARRVSANQAARERAYANPSCDNLRRVAVCSDIDSRLRPDARDRGADPDR